MNLRLEILSPQEIFYNGEVDLCIFPGIEGDIGILKNHMPFLTTLRTGIIFLYKEKKIIDTFLVNGGIIEVSNNVCTLLTEDIIKTSEISEHEKGEFDKLKSKAMEKFYYT
tara:strand:+ start:366 stop:698 length:333 start_codon:yes stop_codon:yes gene_type:complete